MTENPRRADTRAMQFANCMARQHREQVSDEERKGRREQKRRRGRRQICAKQTATRTILSRRTRAWDGTPSSNLHNYKPLERSSGCAYCATTKNFSPIY
jgi:hypothetical protein